MILTVSTRTDSAIGGYLGVIRDGQEIIIDTVGPFPSRKMAYTNAKRERDAMLRIAKTLPNPFQR